MRRFIPRVLNVLSFIFALLIFVPWNLIAKGFDFMVTKWNFTFLSPVSTILTDYVAIRLLAIPAVLIVLSIIYLIAALIDRGIKKHNKVTSKPMENMVYAPIYFMGIAMALLGLTQVLFAKFFGGTIPGFVESDYFGLGKFILMIPSVDVAISLYGAFYAALLVLQLVFALSLRKTNKRGFGGKFFTWLLFLFLAFLSYKGLSDSFASQGTLMESIYSFIGMGGVKPVEADLINNYELYAIVGAAVIGLILYIIIAILRAKKYNKQVKASKTKANNEDIAKEETTKEETKEAEKKNPDMVPYVSPFDSVEKLNDPLYVEPKPEQIVETELVEQTVVKQVVYEESNLDKIYAYEFGFNNCTMVKNENSTDYYVNRVKFLTLSNHNKHMVFRLELDKAIRLIMDIPTIGKDKYENHRVWFKVEDASVLSIDTITTIIKDAYNTVLNNL